MSEDNSQNASEGKEVTLKPAEGSAPPAPAPPAPSPGAPPAPGSVATGALPSNRRRSWLPRGTTGARGAAGLARHQRQPHRGAGRTESRGVHPGRPAPAVGAD